MPPRAAKVPTWSRKITNEMKNTRTSPRFKQSLTHLPNRAADSTAIAHVVTHENVDPYARTEVRSSIKRKMFTTHCYISLLIAILL